MFGEGNFEYAANCRVDTPVWASSAAAVVVNPERGALSAAKRVTHVAQVFDDRPNLVFSLFKAMRPHQWLKNLLVFVPLVMSHKVQEPVLLFQAVLAFAAFEIMERARLLFSSSLSVLPDIKAISLI